MAAPPLNVGDRVLVRGVRSSTAGDHDLHDVVTSVLRINPQHCGCWAITCARPGDCTATSHDTFDVYGADCAWPHHDRIDYQQARVDADEALAEHIRRGGAAPEGDDVGRLLEMLRDAADGRPT